MLIKNGLFLLVVIFIFIIENPAFADESAGKYKAVNKVATEKYADETDPLLTYGVQSAITGKIEKAVEKFKLAYEKSPDVPDVMYGYGWALNRNRQYIEAEKVLYTLHKVAPGYPGLLLELAIAHLGANHLDKALAVLKPFEKSLTGDAAFIYGIAILKTGDTKRAIPYLEQAAMQPELKPAAFYHLIVAYDRIGESEKAEETRTFLTKRGGALAMMAEDLEGIRVFHRASLHPDWKLDLTLGGYYDSNLDMFATGEPLFVSGADADDGLAGFRSLLAVYGGYRFLDSPSMGFLLNAHLAQNLGFKKLDSPQEHSADITLFGLDAAFEFRGPAEGFAWILGLTVATEHSYMRLSDAKSGFGAGLPAKASAGLYTDLGWTSYTVTRIEISEKYNTFPFEKRLELPGDSRMAGFTTSGGLWQRFYFMGRGLLIAGFSANMHNAEGKYKDNNELRGEALLIVPIIRLIDIQAGANIALNSFKESAADDSRADTRYAVNGGFVFFITDNIELICETEYYAGMSNKDFYEFDELVAGTRIIYSF